MASQEELIKLVLDITGAADIASASDKLDEMRAALQATVNAADPLDRATIHLSDSYRKQVKDIESVEKALKGHQRALDRDAASADKAAKKNGEMLAGTGKGAGNAAAKLQTLGQTLDDLQYVGEQGLRPIIGNLMQISPVVGIAAVAISTIAIPAVKALWEAFVTDTPQKAGESIDELKAKIEELEAKPTRLTFENDELDATKEKLEKALEAKRTLDGLLGNQTEREKKSGQAIRDATNTAAGREAVEQAKQARMAEVSPEDQKRLEEVNQFVADAEAMYKDTGGSAGSETILRQAHEKLAALQKEIAAKGEAAFAELARQAISGIGDEQVNAQREYANRLAVTSPFGSRKIGLDLANDIVDNSPERIADKDRAEEQRKLAEKNGKEAQRVQNQNARTRGEFRKVGGKVADFFHKQVDIFNDTVQDVRDHNQDAKDDAKKAAKKAAEKEREQNESRIDKTGVQGQAFALFGQISGMKGKQRRNANAQADAQIQQAVADAIANNPDKFKDVSAEQAQKMVRDAPELMRRRYAEQLQKQRAAMRVGQGRGFHSVSPNGPDVGDESGAGVPDSDPARNDQPDAGGQVAAFNAAQQAQGNAVGTLDQEIGKLNNDLTVMRNHMNAITANSRARQAVTAQRRGR